MKISEMSNDMATEAMIRISSAAAVICGDKEVEDIIKGVSEDKNENALVAIPKYIPKIATLAFRKHKNDLYEIVSALTQKSVEEVGKDLTFGESLEVIKDNIQVIKDFFTF